MKDYKTFLKLQEAAINKQAKAKRQGYEETQTTHLQRLYRQTMELSKVKTSQAKETASPLTARNYEITTLPMGNGQRPVNVHRE
jgi:hypothetical protein